MKRKVKRSARKLGSVEGEKLAAPEFVRPPYRWLLALVLGVEMLLLFWAFAHQFIPSKSWLSIGFYINLVLCILCTAFFTYTFFLNPQLYESKLKKAFVLIGAPLLFYFFGYFALVYGTGDLITQIVGKTAMMEDVFTKNSDDDERFKKEYIAKGIYKKRYFDNRKGCITRLYGDTLKEGLPKHFCVKGEDFAKLPKHVAVKIHGLQSDAGFDVEWIEYDWLKTSFLPTED